MPIFTRVLCLFVATVLACHPRHARDPDEYDLQPIAWAALMYFTEHGLCPTPQELGASDYLDPSFERASWFSETAITCARGTTTVRWSEIEYTIPL